VAGERVDKAIEEGAGGNGGQAPEYGKEEYWERSYKEKNR